VEKPEVYKALARLKPFLESRKAIVKLIYLPPGAHGEKVGLDDFIAGQKAAGKPDGEIRGALFALATSELRRPAGSPVAGSGETDLRNEIANIMLSGDKDFIKRRQVADRVRQRFEREGFLCRTDDDRLSYFNKGERRLYDLDTSAFEYLFTHTTGLGRTESVYGFVLHNLKATAARTAPLKVHTLAHFEPETGFCAVSDAGSGVWARKRGGEWSYQHNGDNGLLFLTEPDAEAFQPAFDADGGNLSWFLNLFLFAPHDALTAEDQKTLMLVNLLHEFFPALRRTRTIPCHLGPQSSGKTAALKLRGRLIVGSRFEVTGLRKEKEDAYIAAVCNRVIVGFDNADSRIPYLPDALATYATGQRYRLRRLYSTNDEIAYDPRASVSISSRSPYFNRPDVAERLLPFHHERPARYIAEPEIFDELARRRNAIWGELLAHLAAIADRIGVQKAPALRFRMADFAAFGWNLFQMRGKAQDWINLLARVEKAQSAFAAENDGVIEVLRALLQRQGGKVGPVTTAALFAACLDIAKAEHWAFPETTQGFGRRLSSAKHTIEVELKCRLSFEDGHAGQRSITIAQTGGETFAAEGCAL
jgi:hypothetical protein